MTSVRFASEDRAVIIELRNRTRPAHLRTTVAEWKRNDAARTAGEVILRLCAGTPAVAYLYAEDRSTTARRKPGVCNFNLWVTPEHRNQGIGSALYDEVVKFADSFSAHRLSTYLTLYEPNKLGVHFLEKRGFAEGDRIAPVMLDLATFERERFTPPAPAGIQFFSYAEAGDTEENRRKFYALTSTLDRDIPTNEGHAEPRPFENFVKFFDRPEWDLNSILLAADAGEWIGISQLTFREHTGIGQTGLTGVLSEYRGRGIAAALKLHAIDAAIARGCPLILTENHEENAPMRAINRKLGFVPDAPGVSYSKNLSPTQ